MTDVRIEKSPSKVKFTLDNCCDNVVGFVSTHVLGLRIQGDQIVPTTRGIFKNTRQVGTPRGCGGYLSTQYKGKYGGASYSLEVGLDKSDFPTFPMNLIVEPINEGSSIPDRLTNRIQRELSKYEPTE